MSFSFAFTSASFQKYSWRPCTHSKYETTTPPAFARMSGRTSTPLSRGSRRRRRDRAVRALDDDLRLDLSALSRRDHLLERARREHVAVEQQQVLVRDRLGAAEAAERAGLALVRERACDVDPVRVVQRRGESEIAITFAPSSARNCARKRRRCRSPARDRVPCSELLLAHRLAHAVERAARGRLLAAERAADRRAACP
jgi:hypothetical protein